MTSSAKLMTHLRRRRWARYLVLAGLLLAMGGLRMTGCKERKLSPQPSPVAEEDYPRYHDRTFKVVKVLDGDTFDVAAADPKANKPQAYTRIRLWGIDTPEIAHGKTKPAMYFGYEAAEFARKQLIGKEVRLELVRGDTRGYYGRLLAYAWLPDGSMYNENAIREGFAYADHRYKHPRKQAFIDLEAEARQKLKGLWQGVQSDQLPRWYKKTTLKDFWPARDGGRSIPQTSAATQPRDKKSNPVRW
jgi:micrococcal nuclease